MTAKEIYLICSECANKAGGKWPRDHIASFQSAVCDKCLQSRSVTEPRDYGLNTDLTLRKKPSIYDIYLARQDEKDKLKPPLKVKM